MDTQALLAELKSRIESKHAEDWRLFERLQSSLLTPASELLDAAGESNRAPSKTLIGAVGDVFRQYPDTPWSVPLLEQQLQKKGYTFAAKNPRISLNTALARLIKRGHIEVCEQGVGRRPSQYKAKPRGNARFLLGRYAASAPVRTNGKVEVMKDDAGELVTKTSGPNRPV